MRSLEGKAFDPRRDPVVCDSFTTGSLIAFYSGGRYEPLLMASAGGIHGLNALYWQDPARWSGRPGLYVGDWSKARTREDFEKAYGGIRELESFTAGGEEAGLPPGRPGQTWRLIRGERLAENPALWRPFLPEGRRRRQVTAP